MTSRLQPGDKAPDFTLPTDTGDTVTLSSLRGQRVIVYFYPAAMTPGCTKQACDFSDSIDRLESEGYTVLGISPDKPEKLAKFRERDDLGSHCCRTSTRRCWKLGAPSARRSSTARWSKGSSARRSWSTPRADRARAVQRQGHRPRRQAAKRPGARCRLTHRRTRRGRSPTAEAHDLGSCQCGFESHRPHQCPSALTRATPIR